MLVALAYYLFLFSFFFGVAVVIIGKRCCLHRDPEKDRNEHYSIESPEPETLKISGKKI
jgi:hypothetical protein